MTTIYTSTSVTSLNEDDDHDHRHQDPKPPHVPLQENQTKKRKRSNGGEKEQRKIKFLNKIICGDKATKIASFKKRKPTLKKKARELEILCDIKVCMICFGPDGSVDTWPEGQKDFKDAIEIYKEFNGKQKHSSIKDIVASKNEKVDRIPCNQDSSNNKIKQSNNLDSIDEFEGDKLVNSVSLLESKINFLKEKIFSLNEANRSQEPPIIGESSESMSTASFRNNNVVPLNGVVQCDEWSQPLMVDVVDPVLMRCPDYGLDDQYCGALYNGTTLYAACNNNLGQLQQSHYVWDGLVLNYNNNMNPNFQMLNCSNFNMINHSSMIMDANLP